jgi:hypothetical protein
MTPLGSNRDRHAPLGEGELGPEGCAAFFSEPRFEGLPAIFEGPGLAGKGAALEDMRVARRLRNRGLKARGLEPVKRKPHGKKPAPQPNGSAKRTASRGKAAAKRRSS